jgi:hypothetical protein
MTLRPEGEVAGAEGVAVEGFLGVVEGFLVEVAVGSPGWDLPVAEGFRD